MYQLIFRNWKFALLWAIGLTASAAAFTEGNGGQAKIQASADQIRAQREQQAAPQPAASASPLPDSAESADEEPAEGDAPVEGGEASDAPA